MNALSQSAEDLFERIGIGIYKVSLKVKTGEKYNAYIPV